MSPNPNKYGKLTPEELIRLTDELTKLRPEDLQFQKGDETYVGRHTSEGVVPEPPSVNPVNSQKLMAFESSIEMLAIIDEQVNSGETTLHPWQVDISEYLCIKNKPTSHKPLKVGVCAANGSGKDSFVTAPFALWFILTKPQSLVVITSSSGQQMTTQTENYIRRLAELINLKVGANLMDVTQRKISCKLTGGEIRMFVTDEAGKAEGHHPLKPGAEMCIIINEAKSVEDEIFQALTRCTGYNYWLEISSPGDTSGHFYKFWDRIRDTSQAFHITAFDCPHLGQAYIDDCKIEWGESSPTYRSMVLAEFTTMQGLTVVKREWLNRLVNKPQKPMFQNWPLRVGIDAGQGADETVVSCWRGNVREAQYCFKEKDASIQVDILDDILGNKLRLPKTHAFMWGDDGVGSKPIMDMLRRKGWRIIPVLNHARAANNHLFVNRIAELWFRFGRLWEEGVLMLPDPKDTRFETQLCERYYVENPLKKGKLQLEGKLEARNNGHTSPDRADAAVLAFSDISLKDFLDTAEQEASAKATRKAQLMSGPEFALAFEDMTYGIASPLAKKGAKIYSTGPIRGMANLNKEDYGISSDNECSVFAA